MQKSLETCLKEAVGKKVCMRFTVAEGDDGYTISGKLVEVTDEYLKIEAMGTFYINRRMALIYFEVYD